MENIDRVKIISIPKRNGKVRVIYAPDHEYKTELRGFIGELNRKQRRLCNASVVHGFMPGKSPVSNAMQHIGHEYTISFDLQDFFESVTPEKAKFLNEIQKEQCFVDGAARQGLPTSPAIANLAAIPLDKAVLKWIDKNNKNIIYTRYADDMTFSFDDPDLIAVIKNKIPEIVKRCGFEINTKKTTCQSEKAGRRIICGVAVDSQGIYPTRAAKRKLRAAQHQGHHREAHGLQEWIALKPPKEKPSKQYETESLETLRKAWKLRKINMDEAVDAKVQAEQDLGSNCYITNDPAYFLGMSTYTTGWVSCMRQPSGQYAKGVIGWLALPGTSVAVFLSKKTLNLYGVERRTMRARVLVHQMTDGSRYYDRFYGNPDDIEMLRNALETQGVEPIREAKKGKTVVGYIPKGMVKPYLDSLNSVIVTTTAKNKKKSQKYKFYV